MANNKMLIDATHPEETRVVVLRGGRVEEFDYESAARKLLRGNIYLAKVTRVEPSLQAAFVDYGGNRHGFLAFNEIHPDYYQIPMADRQALIDEEAAAEAAEEAAADARAEAMARRRERRGPPQGRRGTEATHDADHGDGDDTADRDHDHGENDHGESDRDRHDDGEARMAAADEHADRFEASAEHHASDTGHSSEPQETAVDAPEADHEAHAVAEATGLIDEVVTEAPLPETVGGFSPSHSGEEGSGDDERDAPGDVAAPRSTRRAANDDDNGDSGEGNGGGDGDAESVEQVGAEDALEELPSRPRRRPRSYKIQEVIKRRQVILIQVVKEERGNKGAALTTYLSLAGRYTVLMPNTARGGGISRKITNPQDRKRLKAIAAELEVPEGMGLIIRTAGAARTKQEIKRDFEYLLRLWESVRELTLQSVAPSLVYEEGNLIKRSIRDLYNKDVEEIVVAGDEAYHEARDFMQMLMPSHARNVVEYREPEPLFTRFQIERQLNAMFSPYVTLRSGGYLVINQTEALVAIDVNSGKSTREFSIEETALNTNLEAADEIARQLKLRDLAGLIVIDFIDMEERRNNRKVEQRLKDALRFDRARIQVGRISHFGLMEMSRQRLRTGVLEGSTSQCPHCQGTGIIRSTESVALAVLRGLEDAVMAGARTSLIATTTSAVALYILNNKRPFIIDMERRLGLPIAVQGSDKMQGANFTIEKGAAPQAPVRRHDRNVVNMDWGFEAEGEGEAEFDGEYAATGEDDREAIEGGESRSATSRNGEGNGEGRKSRRRRRRRGRRGDRDEDRLESSPGEEFAGEHSGEDADGDEERPESNGGGEIIEIVEPEDGIEAIGEDGGEPVDEQSGEERRERRGRRRGRRGGRRGRERGDASVAANEGASGGVEDDEIAAGEGAVDADSSSASDHDRAHENVGGTGSAAAKESRDASRHAEPKARGAAAHARGLEPQPVADDASPAPKVAEVAAPTEVMPAEKSVPEPAREESEAQPTASVRARNEATSSEPRLARVVVGPAAGETTEASETATKPIRKGWWQRNFGS